MDQPSLMRAALAVGLATLLFGAAIAFRLEVNPWWSNAIAAIIAIGASLFALPRRWRELLGATPLQLGAAVGVGVLLVVATHLAYRLGIAIAPELERTVSVLYGDIERSDPGLAVTLPLIVFIAAAEEIVWRGVALEAAMHRMPRVSAGLVATGLYVLPQVIGGEWVLIAAAAILGALFALQRLVVGRITPVIVTHAIWSVSIFALVPLQ